MAQDAPPVDAGWDGAAPPSRAGPPSAAPAVTLPAVTLPKGGGALRGLGESFGVRAASGTATMSVPLPFSPARDGTSPPCTLGYESSGGNGTLGFGWALQTPAITRKTDKGLPRYDDAGQSDIFTLAGTDDLVPVLDADGAPATRQAPLWGAAHLVHSFRPRVEAQFTRIERWTALATGLAHWRTVTRDNLTTLYGYDPASRVSDPADPSRIFSWLASRSWDDRGNLTLFDYAAEDGAGIDLAAAHEANRTAQERAAQRYLMGVRYGNTTPYAAPSTAPAEPALPAAFLFQLVLDYGDHTASPPGVAPDAPWALRPDPFSLYRARFELRCYRRVQRLLFFHDFPDEPSCGPARLVRSLDLLYADQLTPPGPASPAYSYLASITNRRYGAQGVVRALPPLTFTYSQAVLQPGVLTLDADSAANLPEGLGGARDQWLDLDGEGAPGVLSDAGRAWLYKRNRSANNSVTLPGGGTATRARFGPLETVAGLPNRSGLAAGAVSLADLSGSGTLDAISWDPAAPGYFSREGEGFAPFRRFAALPRLDWQDPNLRFLDLTGDGLADILLTQEGLFTAYPGLGEAGFDVPWQWSPPWDDDAGPRLIFADGTETIFVADMCGDGMNDLVRIRPGEVSYWPNLGYGRFGARICMDGAPRFAPDGLFDPRRIRLADIDGTGSTDLLYLASDGVAVWFNQSGNAWSQRSLLAVFPDTSALANVQAVDLLGNGTACLVWSSPLPAGGAVLRYVDLMGGSKPHLLLGACNGLGAETRIAYAASTYFYRQDEDAGTPWATRLPFPVQLVQRVETIDWVGRNRFVSRYTYHHGYFDGYEREFRGFARVDQYDTEEFRSDASFPESGVDWDARSFSPPVLTRSWFHTGAFLAGPSLAARLQAEFWQEPGPDAALLCLPESVLPDAGTAYDLQEACRALKGQALRTELFAVAADGSTAAPYLVTQSNYTVICLQPIGPNPHGAFYVHPRETVSLAYEAAVGDPRIQHQLVLQVDGYGNVLRSAALAYSRRAAAQEAGPPPPAAAAALAADQGRLQVTATVTTYTNAVDDPAAADAFRAPLPCATDTAALAGLAAPAAPSGVIFLLGFAAIDAACQQAWTGANDLPYEAVPPASIDGTPDAPGPLTRRLLAQTRTLYRADSLAALLQPGGLESLALPGESHTACLTPGQAASVFGSTLQAADYTAAGYVTPAGEAGWWAPSGRLFYSPGAADAPATELAYATAHFFRPHRATDPFGATTQLGWDGYDLLPATATDAVGNVTAAANDYRVLAACLLTDPNGNRSAAAFDAWGLVTATAAMGKADEALGDSLTGFVADIDDATLASQLADPLADPASLLGNATTRIVADFGAYARSLGSAAPAPGAIYTLRRETHVSDLAAGAATRYQHSLAYSDGFGRIIQSKALAAPGPLAAGGPAVTRWTGTGWTVLDNKARPVRRYEPFFSATPGFEFAPLGGVWTTLFYDPPGRAVATLFADASWAKRVIGAWRQERWDRNDTVLSDPLGDPDVGAYFSRYFAGAAFTSWYAQRIGGTYGATAEAQAAQQDAAQKAALHAGTPQAAWFDPLGRLCLALADNGGGQTVATRTAYDTQGNPLAAFDAAGHPGEEYVLRAATPGYIAGTDMAGHLLYRISADGGARRMLPDALGRPARSFDARSQAFRMVYDPAGRRTQRLVSLAGGPEALIELAVYGEGMAAANLCGRLFRRYDRTGFLETTACDFKGNVTAAGRQLATAYRASTDWSPLLGAAGAAALDAAAQAAGLVPSGEDRFDGSTVFDALDRPIQRTTLHGTAMRPNVLQRSYDEGGLPTAVDAWLQLAAPPTQLLDPASADRHIVTAIGYDAHGRPVAIGYGNAAATTLGYDPQTFRLATRTTTRPGAAAGQSVQDLAYFYDPAGNVTTIRDDADTQNAVFFRNQRVEPSSGFTYDPLYRLIAATGREHVGQTGTTALPPLQVTQDDSLRTGQPQPSDGQAMATYQESYSYDANGNMLAMAHATAAGGWTRRYSYAEPSEIDPSVPCNRLSATSLPGDQIGGPYGATHAYDAHGNMTRMLSLPAMAWDEDDQLRATTRQVVASGTPQTSYYLHGADGARIRKVTDAQAAAGQAAPRRAERIYLDELELYREFAADGTTVTLARESLGIEAGAPAARIETRTQGSDDGPAQQVRYQFGNQLNSAVLELDDSAAVVSYEEYFPFGSTSYQAVAAATDVAKRYRFAGRERDTENDLYSHGARSYIPWLGRWTSCDPAGWADGPCPYAYVRNNPVRLADDGGREANDAVAPPSRWQRLAGQAANAVHQAANAARVAGAVIATAYDMSWGPTGPPKILSFKNFTVFGPARQGFVAGLGAPISPPTDPADKQEWERGQNVAAAVNLAALAADTILPPGPGASPAPELALAGGGKAPAAAGEAAPPHVLLATGTGGAPAPAQATGGSEPDDDSDPAGGAYDRRGRPLTEQEHAAMIERVQSGQPLTTEQKTLLRADARAKYFAATGKTVPEGSVVHHLRNLQHAQLFPGEDPSAAENLAVVKTEIHEQLHATESGFLKGVPLTRENVAAVNDATKAAFADELHPIPKK